MASDKAVIRDGNKAQCGNVDAGSDAGRRHSRLTTAGEKWAEVDGATEKQEG